MGLKMEWRRGGGGWVEKGEHFKRAYRFFFPDAP